jgi:hypothetical protein
LLGLAVVGATLLAGLALYRWNMPTDEYAYWLAAKRLLAGEPLYDPAATLVTPFAYLYPPPLAQALAPLAAVLPDWAFIAGWTLLLLACVWWLAGRNVFVALAFVAFLPVAAELWSRNVHLVLAVLVVLGLRRGGWWLAIAASIKMAPVLGVAYLAARGRWRDAAITAGPGLLPVPFWVRAAVGAVLAVVAGRLRPRVGEPLLVVALVIANPTLYATALSMLVAIVLLWRSAPRDDNGTARDSGCVQSAT